MPRVKAQGLIFNRSASAGAIASLNIKFEPAIIISARKVDKLGLSIRSFKEPLRRAVREVMIPSIRRNFDAEGRPSWSALADSTIRGRANQNYASGPILNRSGRLRRVMGQQNIWTIDREKAYIADLPDSVWYGKVHQAGATFKVRGGGFRQVSLTYLGRPLGQRDQNAGSTGTIPARPFVILQKMDEIRIQKIFNDWINERVRAAGLSSRRV